MAKTKFVIENKKRFFTVISVAIVFVVCMGILITSNQNKTIDPSTSEKYAKNVDKYSAVLKEEYSKDGMMEKFVMVYDSIQKNAVDYAFSKVTEEENSFDLAIQEVNVMLKEKEYSKLNLEKTDVDFWVGTFKVDETGKLKFTFASADMCPDWVTNDVVAGKIE